MDARKPRIAVLGYGSWATAIAKIVLENQPSITWFIRKQETIEEFKATGKNPRYLSTVHFDTAKIHFSADINEVISEADVLILAIPSPYVKLSLNKLRRSIRQKYIISAVKGMIPDENMIVTDYLHIKYHVPMDHLAVVAGPCHAEEIALDRLSYLTLGCEVLETSKWLADLFDTPYVRCSVSEDVVGLEYSSVMKNIYAIAAGMCHGLHYGDNFQAVLMSNAMQEIQRFLTASNNIPRDVDCSGYLGDVLVTAYSKFSRNRQFGLMIGMGYSVKAAQIEMEMVAEGYYGTNAIHIVNQRLNVSLPIAEAMYEILYNRQSPTIVIKELTKKLR
ncbi:MAG: NAD(P)-binding domain-containing protein [Paludibacteraceae bacterium]|nr:NAD(P)-binding domain-containing protein [Paludibacteraceae bacterium]